MFLTLWYVGLPVRRTMTAPAVAAALLVFSALRSCQATPCVLPQPGKCSTDNSSATNNNKVCGLEAGNCRFTSKTGLCSYQQGCADQGMTNWTANQGRAEARQKSAGSCGKEYYYSVLESPWLNFSHVSCLKFVYLRTKPSALDVFLERENGEVLTLLNRSDDANHNTRNDITRTIYPGIGKVLFRAYGGGGGTDAIVKVFKVSVEPGICTWSGELFTIQFKSSGTESSNFQKQAISHLISPTVINQNRTDCLRFQYRTQTSASRLTVSIQPHLEEQTSTVIWNYTSSKPQPAETSGVCPIQVNASFKIIFTEHSSSPGHQVNVSIIDFRRWQEKKNCKLSPSGTSTSATDMVISSSGTASPASSGQCVPLPPSTTTDQTSTQGSGLITTRPLMTSTVDPMMTSTVDPMMTSTPDPMPDTTHPVIFPTTSYTPDHSGDSGMGGSKAEDNPRSTVIALAVVAVVAAVAIAALLVIGVIFFLWRRRRTHDHPKRPESEDEANPAVSQRNPADEETHRDGNNAAAPSNYDTVGELSPPNVYGSLQSRENDVTSSSVTSTAPVCDVSQAEAASYYNIGGQARPEANPYYNVEGVATPSADEEDHPYE